MDGLPPSGPDAKVNETADHRRSTPAHPLGRFRARQMSSLSEDGRLNPNPTSA